MNLRNIFIALFLVSVLIALYLAVGCTFNNHDDLTLFDADCPPVEINN